MVDIQFLTYIFNKFSEKNENSKKKWKPQKNTFLIYLHHFSIFNVISEEFKFSKVFWTRSTFNALILQSLIFCWVNVDIALFKKYKKIRKIKIYKKKREKRKEKEKLKDQFGNLAILLL
jgi:fucose 4-O-acetylase-like acetyltransferase